MDTSQPPAETSSSSNEDSSSNWLHAYYDPSATLYTFSTGICLIDLHGDGEFKLIVADLGTGTYNMKLKVYKGIHLISEHTMVDLPTGLVAFHMDTCDSRSAAIAVASGGNIFVYKNMRPFYKFTLPSLEVTPTELELWNQIKEGDIDINTFYEVLETLRTEIKESNLSPRSQKFLKLSPEDMPNFIQAYKDVPIKRQTIITCITTMKKSITEEIALSCLVLGTESKQIYILEPNAFTILSVMTLPSVPVFIDVNGLYDVEYSISVTCRDGALYLLKRGYKSGKLCADLSSQPVGLERHNANIVVGCMDEKLYCYTLKGKCLWAVKLPASIVVMEGITFDHLSVSMVAVSLSSGVVHFYQDKYLVDILHTEEVVTGIKFGRFGREENSLIMATKGGGLIVKILKRTAQFENFDLGSKPATQQNLKLNVPKKTKLFVDQTMRERDMAIQMHRIFQADMFRLKLYTQKEFYKSITSAFNPIADAVPLRLSVLVQGIGPMFQLVVNIKNSSMSSPLYGLYAFIEHNMSIYKIDQTIVSIPLMVPEGFYSFKVKVELVYEQNTTDLIKVYVMSYNDEALVTAAISMPISEGIKSTRRVATPTMEEVMPDENLRNRLKFVTDNPDYMSHLLKPLTVNNS